MVRLDDFDEDLPDAAEDYHESSDEDFNPATAPAEESSTSSDEEDTSKQTTRKGKRKAPTPDELDSGDEVTIQKARKRKKKRKGDQDDDDLLLSDGEGGEAGLIKTRAQRKVEQKERRPLARIDGATVDVDALWAQMSAAPLQPLSQVASTPSAAQDLASQGGVLGGLLANTAAPVDDETDLVAVKKTYTFAGQRTTEEKQIPRSSLDQHLSDGWKVADIDSPAQANDTPDGKQDGTETDDSQPKVRRPLRRPSRFDPNPTGYVRTLPPEHQLTWPRKVTTSAIAGQENAVAPDAPKPARPEKAQKLNVVDKSRLDWTGFVDKEGIAEELDVHGKTKEAYLGRMQFLAGVEAKQEEERRRMKSTATS